MLCFLAEGQWNQGVQPGGEQTSTQVTIPKDVSSIVGNLCLFFCFCFDFYCFIDHVSRKSDKTWSDWGYIENEKKTSWFALANYAR